jgi:mannose-6-phosphate isomerase-like protein (cupin superfamily)
VKLVGAAVPPVHPANMWTPNRRICHRPNPNAGIMEQVLKGTNSIVLRNAFNSETFIFPDVQDDPSQTTFRCVLEKGGSGGGNGLLHIHRSADETFKIHSGQIVLIVDGHEHLVEAGKSATVPRGTPHCFRNGGVGTAEMNVVFTPAQNHREFFVNFATLVKKRPQWFSAKGDPNFLLIALVLHTYRNHLYLAGIPIVLQKFLFACLAPIARLRGYQLETLPNERFHK